MNLFFISFLNNHLFKTKNILKYILKIMNEIIEPGKYYLGDPANVLHEKIFIGIYGNLYNYSNGKFYINDTNFVVHSSHNGDGIFKDTKNRKYNIVSGFIALTNLKLIDDIELCKKNGHVFEFKNKINFIYDAGIFYIKSGKKYINIDTINHDEYNSDLEEHCENDEGEYISKILLADSDTDSIKPIFDVHSDEDNEDNNEYNEDNNDNNNDDKIENNYINKKVSFQFFKK
jgi:hypothetical protein